MSIPLLDLTPRRVYHFAARRLFPGKYRIPGPEWVKVAAGPFKGGELFIAVGSTDTWAKMAAGTADSFLFDALTSNRPIEGACIWDIGAHFGYHSLVFASLVGATGRVVAFEPNPANTKRFQMHLDHNPQLAKRITLKEAAVADRAGETTFMLNDAVESGVSTGSHLTGVNTPLTSDNYAFFRPQTVKLVSVDDLVATGQAPPPTVLKIDVEGAEGLVLKGAAATLDRYHPPILMEVHHILEMYGAQNFLRERGYKMTILDVANAAPSRCFVLAEHS
jgi:FkbM family methyltransferase